MIRRKSLGMPRCFERRAVGGGFILFPPLQLKGLNMTNLKLNAIRDELDELLERIEHFQRSREIAAFRLEYLKEPINRIEELLKGE